VEVPRTTLPSDAPECVNRANDQIHGSVSEPKRSSELSDRSEVDREEESVIGPSTLPLNEAAERIFQFSMPRLPTRPLDVFRAEAALLPKSTEAERLVVQRLQRRK
jgi:hypothetical protein